MDETIASNDGVPPEGGEVSEADRAAFIRARFKRPETADRRGEKLIKAAEQALAKEQERTGG